MYELKNLQQNHNREKEQLNQSYDREKQYLEVMKFFLNILRFIIIFLFSIPIYSFSGNCDYDWQYDSAGRSCGGRAANVREGGRLGGDGRYTDSFGRLRLYGKSNDPYDKPKTKKPHSDFYNTYSSSFNSSSFNSNTNNVNNSNTNNMKNILNEMNRRQKCMAKNQKKQMQYNNCLANCKQNRQKSGKRLVCSCTQPYISNCY